MINHAIIGCGRVSENHADAFSRIEGVQIKYAVDINKEKAEALAERFSIKNVRTDFKSILNDPELTSISLAVPHYLHGPMAIDAANAGKHVLIEKPTVLLKEEGVDLKKAALKTGIVASPVLQHRYDKIVSEIKELIQSGDLGKLYFVRGHLECKRPSEYYKDSEWRGLLKKEGGSVLINQAYHLLDLLLFLSGPVKSVNAEMNTFQKEIMETEDALTATLSFKNGALGSLSICGVAGSSWKSYIELIGENGLVAFDINFPNQLHRFELKSKKSMRDWRNRLRAALPDPTNVTPGMGYYGLSHRDQAEDFIAEIRKQKKTSGATLDEALYVMDVIHDIYDSANENKNKH